ncbi:hypothetical protein NBO_589g0001 [Nosema bombycis CQ1]|uniref:Uncharacterized protein n=1 Tax=Nosema bombycis (strain CQ1 / CVCC 102059) TaxID=578461 RepID=R0KMY8_NOSB1|nr:hypothetical protein NBO_589g0001 [Nosema bombycis CQ1]|eukprot:EOB12016.1 hypothetical protein NBO_589g0001 [Nosema bombycis CQ1]
MKLIIIFIIISVTTASEEASDDTRICEHYCDTGFLRDDYYEKVGYRSFFDYFRKDEHECIESADLGRDGVFSFIRNEPPASVAGYIEDIDPEEVGLECVKADVNDFGDVTLNEDSCEGVLGYLQGVKPDGIGYEGTVDFLRGDKPEEVGYEGAVIYFRGLGQESGLKNVKQKYVENEEIYLETVNFHHCDEFEDNDKNQCNVPDIEIDEAIVFNPPNDVYEHVEIDFDSPVKSFEPEKEENIYFECIKPNDVEEHVIKLPCYEEFQDFSDENYGFVEIEVYPKNKTRGVCITLPADKFDGTCSHSEYLHKLASKYFSNNDNFNVIPKILNFDACPEDYDPACDDYSKDFKPRVIDFLANYNDLDDQLHPINYDDSLQGDDPKIYSFTPIEYNIEDFDIKPVDFSKDLHKNFEPINISYGGNEFVLYLKEDGKVYPNKEKPNIVDFKDQNTSSEHQTDINSPNEHTSENNDEDLNFQGDDPDVIDLGNNQAKSLETKQQDNYDNILILFIYLQNDNLIDYKQEDVTDRSSLTKGDGLTNIDTKHFIEQDDPKSFKKSVVNRSKVVNDDRNNRDLNVFFTKRKLKKRIFLIFIFSRSRQLIKR